MRCSPTAEAAAGLAAGGRAPSRVVHMATRDAGHGCVDLWPLERERAGDGARPWAPVDAEPPESANKKLAGRIARAIKAMVGARARRCSTARPGLAARAGATATC